VYVLRAHSLDADWLCAPGGAVQESYFTGAIRWFAAESVKLALECGLGPDLDLQEASAQFLAASFAASIFLLAYGGSIVSVRNYNQ
jgi:hypothetical protein